MKVERISFVAQAEPDTVVLRDNGEGTGESQANTCSSVCRCAPNSREGYKRR